MTLTIPAWLIWIVGGIGAVGILALAAFGAAVLWHLPSLKGFKIRR